VTPVPESVAQLGAVDQIAYVVHDMDAAVERYGRVFGPFVVKDTMLTGCTYRGRTVDMSLLVAHCLSGALDIELIEPRSEAPHAEYLAQHGEGLHHVRFTVSDLEGALAALEADGFRSVFSGVSSRSTFVYVEHPDHGPSMIELVEPLAVPTV
jgi:catechol 2,3-dioxygenase-like lactoylglutathione lyase family enzyme